MGRDDADASFDPHQPALTWEKQGVPARISTMKSLSSDAISHDIERFICDNLLHDPAFRLDRQVSLTGDGVLDSFRLTQLATHLEEQYNVSVDMVDLVELVDNGRDSVDEIVQFVIARRA